MKGLFSEGSWTYPLHLRQAMADQQHSPQRDNGTYRAELDKFYDFQNPVSYEDYQKGE